MEKRRLGLDGFTLKMIGIVLMVLDHLHQMFFMFGVPLWFTMAGRIVAPIFLFLSVEGYCHTRSKGKYLLRLLVGAWLMGLVNLLFQLKLPMEDVALTNNIFGTLFLAVFYMWMIELCGTGIKQRNGKLVMRTIGWMLLPAIVSGILLALTTGSVALFRLVYILFPNLLFVEGSVFWVALGVGFYLGRKHRWLQLAILAAFALLVQVGMGGFQWMVIWAAIPLALYNQKPGRRAKWFFYLFYPAHIYLFYVISWLMH